MKVTMIGASGFVGTRLIDLLKDDVDYNIKNIDIQPSHFFNDMTIIGDVRDQVKLDSELIDSDVVVLLAAQHSDNVNPISLYYDVNVGGMEKTLKAMEKNKCRRIIFFSSVAIYGLNTINPNEDSPVNPFNHYGKSKWQAEQVLQDWYKTHQDWSITIVRPTVIFGERNRGNVYNLLSQIANGRFIMVGKGENQKSMSYVGNVVAFVKYILDNNMSGYSVYNYVDKPDLNMNQLVNIVKSVLNKGNTSLHLPYIIGLWGGYIFDVASKLMRKNFSISSIRVRKFCATSIIDGAKLYSTAFKAPYTLSEGLSRTLEFEFIDPRPDQIEFLSE